MYVLSEIPPGSPPLLKNHGALMPTSLTTLTYNVLQYVLGTCVSARDYLLVSVEAASPQCHCISPVPEHALGT